MNSFRVALILIISLPTAVTATNGVTVDVQPLPKPVIQEFDPAKPPADLAGEGADAKTSVEIEATGVGIGFNPNTQKFVVESLDPLTVSGQTVIRLPKDAKDKLKDHEDGHHELNDSEYKNSSRKVKDAFRGFVGSEFMGMGSTFQDRAADANSKIQAELDRRLETAKKAIEQQMGVLGKKYDDLTDHGKSDAVDTEKGKKEALKERNRAPKAGEQGAVPNSDQPLAGVSQGALVSYSSQENRVHFQGSLFINTTQDPLDSILGRGLIQIESTVLIGPQENGTLHLSDTILTIRDIQTNDLLLNGFVFELAYMPSSLPQFPAMFQGYLDVPPPFASQGLTNSIGSPFLSSLQTASLSDETTGFWFYTDETLFDESGRPLIPDSTVSGSLQIGIFSPEPTSLILFASGLLGLITLGRPLSGGWRGSHS